MPKVICEQEDLDAIVAEAQDQAVRDALSPMKTTQVTGYFSSVRFRFVRSGAGPTFTYTCAASQSRIAFSYATNTSDIQQAGFAPGFNSWLRWTNLSEANKTRDGETYRIKGLSLYRGATSDAFLSALVWDTAAMQMTMNTNSVRPLGCLHFFPSTSGLSGRGFTRLQTPPLDSSFAETQLLQNSIEEDGSYFKFKDPIIWRPAGKVDSSLSVSFIFPNDIVTTATARAVAAGVAPYDPPATDEIGTYVDITVRLIGESISDISVNQ